MKKQLLYLSSIADDAPQTAKDYGLGLELAQFCTAAFLDNPDKVTELFPQDCARYLESSLAACLSSSDRFVLHGPFNELCPAAIDPLVLEITEKRYRQAIDRAVSLGCPKLVLHAGFVPLVYHPEWFVSRSVLVWKRLMREVPETLTVCLENVMEPQPRLLADIARQVDDPRLGLCLDVGHANTFVSRVPPLEWVAPMAPWLRHVHLHNNAGHDDLHDPLGQGTLAMEQVLDTILELCPAATFTLENQDCGPSLDWLRQHGYGANT